jgi:hypothetical protein
MIVLVKINPKQSLNEYPVLEVIGGVRRAARNTKGGEKADASEAIPIPVITCVIPSFYKRVPSMQ